MKENGFTVQVEDVSNLTKVKEQYQIPASLQSCHTAIVDCYIIEGHVPAADVERLLAERPDIAGLSVPGMPPGSPGMDAAGVNAQPFDVIAFDKSGDIEVYTRYSQ